MHEASAVDPARAASVVELLDRAVEGQFDADVCAWLQEGLRRYARDLVQGGGSGPRLEQYLRLPRGAVEARIERRDRALLRAAVEIDGFAEMLPKRRAEALRAAVERFRVHVWPRWRSASVAPTDGSRLYRALFEALRADPDPPTSVRHYLRILQGFEGGDTETACDVTGGAG